jgi:excisionase family DNA binding protein
MTVYEQCSHEDRLLRVSEVAQRLQLHKDTIVTWLEEGLLPGFKLPHRSGWRVRLSELEAWEASLSATPRRSDEEATM